MKNCVNCRSQIADEVQVCPVCGAVQVQQGFGQQPQQGFGGQPMQQGFGQPMQPGYGMQGMPAKKNHTKLIIGVIAGLIVAIAAVILVLVLVRGGGSYKDTAKKFLDAVCAGNGEKAAKYCVEPMRDEISAGVSMIKLVLAFYGEDAKISYTLGNSTELNQTQITAIEEKLKDEYNYSCTIKSAYSVAYTTTIKAGGENETSNDSLVVAKIKGKWYVVDGGM